MNAMITWFLIVLGALLVLLEVVLGAISGFDFLLIGSALLAGGIVGLALQEPLVGLASAGLLAILYVAIGRSRIRRRLRRPGIPSNTDAILGQIVSVTQEVQADHAGRIRHEGEEWRALLDTREAVGGTVLAAGVKARVTRVDGVTVYIVPDGSTGSPGKESP